MEITELEEKASSESSSTSSQTSEKLTIRDLTSPPCNDDADPTNECPLVEDDLGDVLVKEASRPNSPYAKILETLRRIEDEEKVRLPFHPCSNGKSVPVPQPSSACGSGDSREMEFTPRPLESPPASPKHFKITKTISKSVPPANIMVCSSMTLECNTAGSSSTSSTPRLPPIPGHVSNHVSSTGCYFSNSPRVRIGNGHGDGDNCQSMTIRNELYELQPLSSRSYSEEPIKYRAYMETSTRRPSSALGFSKASWEPASTDKARDIYSFLDEVEKVDRETLFHLKMYKNASNASKSSGSESGVVLNSASSKSRSSAGSAHVHGLDSLMAKGAHELAQEVYLMERKIDEYKHNISLLEDTIANQRELNIRHIKNSERDLRKRLKLQQEEFDLALSRHQAFVDQVISEKRLLQEKCEKLLRDFKDEEERHKNLVKSMQEKHLDEIKRLRKVHESSEKTRKAQWIGVKTQEIRDSTLKGLEPQLQRVIRRHQTEMAEMRAWHESELQELEERSARKFAQQAKEIREQAVQEQEVKFAAEREALIRRHESELEKLKGEVEALRERGAHDLAAQERRLTAEFSKLEESLREQVKAVEARARIDLENVKQEYEGKLLMQTNQHGADLKTLRCTHEAEMEAHVQNYNQRLELAIAEKETNLMKRAAEEKALACEDLEKKLRQELQKLLKEQETEFESKLRRQQEKWAKELEEMEQTERDLKQKLAMLKNQLMTKEDEIFALRSSLSAKEKQVGELAESNGKMIQERVNLTAVIKKEFESQIQGLEQQCLEVKSAILEIKTKHKIEEEQYLLNMEKLKQQKDSELQSLGQRVVQAMTRKDETINELQTQLENSAVRIQHLEDLLEQQRKEFLQNVPSASVAVKRMSSSTSCKSSYSKHQFSKP